MSRRTQHAAGAAICSRTWRYRFRHALPFALAVSLALTTLAARPLAAGERELITLAEMHLRNREYHSAVTELMRYQHLHPLGALYPRSLLLMSTAYFEGNNYTRAIDTARLCYDRFRNNPEGEEALYRLGHMRLLTGSAFMSFSTFDEYIALYPQGRFSETVLAERPYAHLLAFEIDDAKSEIENYRRQYPAGAYLAAMDELDGLIAAEEGRPKKKMWVAVLGSVFIPGFGNFYTENYWTGLLSFLSNGVLIYLIYDAAVHRDTFRMVFFGLLELSFYQWSIISAVNNVYEYNYPEDFRRGIRLSLSKRF
ncbi:MAG TPA: outer membrane protein assembly factor BamD [Spirochaetota bacterium]|nr:outer membrane protein assembly factor BamD [Spirochaetota bacterium]HNT10858.1 outer membrane protein assembly factor BamD [Spirochaetota bacterium]